MLETLRKIAFERVGGSPEELKALEIIADEVRNRGIEPTFESFNVKTFRAGEGSVELLIDPPQTFVANPIGLSGTCDITGPARYVETANLDNLDDAKGEIILLQKRISYDIYRNLARLKVGGFLLVNEPGKTPGYPMVKESLVEKFGAVPGAVISYEAGRKIISAKNPQVRFKSKQEALDGTSHNLIAVIPGKIADEEIVIGGHADSVVSSPGAVDNGSGCVEILGLIGHFAKNKPRRTLRFCFFGSEELGLLGSKEYVRAHADDLANVKMMVNLDLGGDIFGENKLIVTGSNELTNYLDSRNKLTGMGLRVTRGIYSSDNMPFARAGIPAISFGRAGLGASMGHSRDDDMRNVNEASLRSMANIALQFVDEIANARVFPFDREIPKDIEDEVEKYFYDKTGEQEAK